MRCDDCHRLIDPETDRHAVVREQLVAPDLGTEADRGWFLCGGCTDVSDRRLAPSHTG